MHARQHESERRVSARQSALPDWTGRTVTILATGPSLDRRQIRLVREARRTDRCRVIAINEAGLRRFLPLSAPWADILYAADAHWWSHYKPSFYGLRLYGEIDPNSPTPPKAANVLPLHVWQRGDTMGLLPGEVLSGGHSGFQALNLALTLGARKVILLGYDCGGSARNCHRDRAAMFTQIQPPFDAWAAMYDRVPVQFPNQTVVLCSPESRISAFENMDLEDAL